MGANDIEEVFRSEAGRALSTLIRLVGDFELAEEALQEALASAVEQWPTQGTPTNPRAWLVHVGRHKAIDRVRRQRRFEEKRYAIETEAALGAQLAASDDQDSSAFGDDLLRLIFTCCHPALDLETQVALTLRAVCGLTTEAVARAFLVATETMAQRLVRAKRKIRIAGIPYETPSPGMLDARVDGVLAVVYLVFTEWYAGTVDAGLAGDGLASEAIRLGRTLDTLLPDRPAIKGLLALMLLHHARRAARLSASGEIILLDDQDRSLWDQTQIRDGLALLDRALGAGERPSTYVVQAAIAALHARAPHRGATDWPQIVGLYEVLIRIHSSPVVELNHAVAVSMVDGPARGLALLDALAARRGLELYHLLPAARASLLRQLDRRQEARGAYRQALDLARTDPERRWFARLMEELA